MDDAAVAAGLEGKESRKLPEEEGKIGEIQFRFVVHPVRLGPGTEEEPCACCMCRRSDGQTEWSQ